MLSLATVRHRWRTLLGTFVALSAGVGLLSATAVVITSATAQPPPRYADAAVLVSAPEAGEDDSGYPHFRPWSNAEADRLAAGLAELDGVRTAVADRSFPAQLVADGRLLGPADVLDPQGHNWSSTVLGGHRLLDGAPPDGPREVVVSADWGLRAGDAAVLHTAATVSTVTVSGTVDGPGVYLADDVAARLSSGSLVIGLVLADGADAGPVAEHATRLVGSAGMVRAGAERAWMETEADTRTRWVGAQLLVVMGVLSGFVSVFVVATTFAFVVTQRRRELALLRVVGATPGQVRRTLLGEAVVIGLAGAAAGIALGAALAPVLGGWMVDAGLEPKDWRPRTFAAPLAGSALVGLVVALLGVWSASRRASRIRPLEALRESAVEHRPMTPARWVFGVSGVVLGVVAAVLTPVAESTGAATAATFAVVGLVVGATLLGPVYLPPLVRALCRPFGRLAGPTVELVREGSVIGVRRVASTTAPILVTVAVTVLVTGYVETADRVLSAHAVAEVPTSVVVAPAAGSPGLSDAAVDAVAAGRLAAALPTGVVVDGRWLDAMGVDGGDLAVGSLPTGSLPAGSLAPDHLAVTGAVAAELGWRPGQDVPVTWADGTSGTARVAAVVDDSAPAPVLLSRATARAHDPAALTPIAYVDGVDPAALDAALAPLAADALRAAEYEAAGNLEEERLVRLFIAVLLALVLGFTVLAIVNTLAMATGERRREFAVLRLSGASVGQVLRVVVAEAVLLAVLGTVLGAAAAVPGLLGIAAGLADDFGDGGFGAGVALPWPMVLAVTGVCLVVAVAASAVPARLAMRRATPM